MSTSWKRAVRCLVCGERVKRASAHVCEIPDTGLVEPETLLEEIRALRSANRAHVASLRRRGRIGTHPGRGS